MTQLPHSAMRLDREAFHESLDDMKNAINPAPALPSSDNAPSASSITSDWRGAFRLGALDLNPDLRSTFELVSPDSPPEVPTPSHWILEDRLLSRMIAALQADAAELAQWQQRRGAASAICSPLVLIRQLGFEHQPQPTTALDQFRFLVRFTVACVALTTRCICRAAIVEQSFRGQRA